MPFIYQLVISFVGKGVSYDREVSRRNDLSTFRFYRGNEGIPAETQEIYGTHLLLANKDIYFSLFQMMDVFRTPERSH